MPDAIGRSPVPALHAGDFGLATFYWRVRQPIPARLVVSFRLTDAQDREALGETRRWTEEEREAIRREIGSVYATFLARVSEARKMTTAEVERVAQGRVWTGAQALERRLVDRLGSLQDAIALARDRAGLPGDAEIRRLEASRGLLEILLPGAAPGEGALEQLLARAPEVRATAALLEMGPVVALPLGWVTPVARDR